MTLNDLVNILKNIGDREFPVRVEGPDRATYSVEGVTINNFNQIILLTDVKN